MSCKQCGKATGPAFGLCDDCVQAQDRRLRDETLGRLRAERATTTAQADNQSAQLMEAYKQFHEGVLTANELQRHVLHLAFLVNELALIDEQITELEP